MLFNSFEFLFVFLPITLLLWWWPTQHRRLRLSLLTLASYFFYGFGGWWYCLLILASTFIDYFLGGRLHAATDTKTRRRLLLVSLGSNLGLLGIFKYLGFFSENLNLLLETVQEGSSLPVPAIALPIGISFYTFQSMSYTIDIYRRRVEPAPNFITFAAFVSLFPQLIAGPIVRYSAIEEQLRVPSARLNPKHLAVGLQLFVLGLAKKLLIADVIAAEIDPLFARSSELGFADAWFAALGYTLQIYFDFSGYSDMAVGLGRMLGFTLPENFKSPYKATSITDFWRRWHITLSEWLRDYLYIPLGGGKNGLPRAALNATTTFLLGGLWHGASWNFVLWGLLHGCLLTGHRLAQAYLPFRVPTPAAQGITFLSVVFSWVLFRVETVGGAGAMFRAMLGVRGFEMAKERILLLFMILAGGCGCFLLPNTTELRPRLGRRAALLLGVLFVACLLSLSRPSPFLYFRF